MSSFRTPRARSSSTVCYALSAGPLGEVAHAQLVRRDLDRIFAFRAAAVPQAVIA